jgi:hypothetical protein
MTPLPLHNIQVLENTRTEFLNIVYNCMTASYIADDEQEKILVLFSGKYSA